MYLTKASQQWANRPEDQRFWTVQELYDATKAHHEAACTAALEMKSLKIVASQEGSILLAGQNNTAELTHWAFGQLCARVGAPAGYLRTLTPELAVQNLSEGIGNTNQEPATALLHQNGGYFCRAITSKRYTRIWNDEVVQRLFGFESQGWRVPPARPTTIWPEDGKSLNLRTATKEDAALSLTVKEGDTIGPSGLYASFEDMFAFMIHPDKVVRDGTEGGLMRGFFVWNSEVGKSTFGISTFYFRGVCGNHNIFGASSVKDLSLRHIGDANNRASQGLEIELKKYAEESATDAEAKISLARKFILKNKTKEDVVNFIFSQRILTRRDAIASYDAVVPEEDGYPYTAWGFAQGITRLSQTAMNADRRVSMDRAAGKIIEMAF